VMGGISSICFRFAKWVYTSTSLFNKDYMKWEVMKRTDNIWTLTDTAAQVGPRDLLWSVRVQYDWTILNCRSSPLNLHHVYFYGVLGDGFQQFCIWIHSYRN
jgi:hypothetical protein